MPEPTGIARLVGEILPRIYRSTMHDDHIDDESDSYVILEKGRTILIDPLPMSAQDLKQLGPVKAIYLTASCHERATSPYRRSLKVPIYAPQGGVDFKEPPDHWYKAGDRLPGGLLAVQAPGPTEAHYAFYLERDGGVVFCADLLTYAEGERLAFVPGGYQDEPARTRESVRRQLVLRFETLCSNHGHPVTSSAKEAMPQAMAQAQAGSRS